MSASKPKHIATVGNVRLTVLGGKSSRHPEAASFTLERRPQSDSESWYPAAGYRIEDLASLSDAVQSAIQFLHPDRQTESSGHPDESPVAAVPTSAATVEETPPFDPTPTPVPLPSPSPLPTAPSRRSARKPSRPPTRPATVRVPAKSNRRLAATKSRSRSR